MATGIEARVAEALALGRGGDMAACWRAVEDIVVEGVPSAEVAAAMAAADPERTVWDSPARPGETGLGGHPMATGRFRFCSDVYGHDISLPAGDWSDADLAFVDACMEGYDDALLHDCGHVVVDADGSLAFLVTVRLDGDGAGMEDAVAGVAGRHGVEAALFAWPNAPCQGGGYEPGYVCATALLRDPSAFGLARDIVSEFAEAERDLSSRGPRP